MFASGLLTSLALCRHGGDNRSGDAEGDDEVVKIQLDKVPEAVASLIFVVSAYGKVCVLVVASWRCVLVLTVYCASQASFGLIKSMYGRLLNNEIGEEDEGPIELAKFKLKLREGNTYSAVAVCLLTRLEDGNWGMEAAGITAAGVSEEAVVPLFEKHILGNDGAPPPKEDLTPGDKFVFHGTPACEGLERFGRLSARLCFVSAQVRPMFSLVSAGTPMRQWTSTRPSSSTTRRAALRTPSTTPRWSRATA